jgi:hypothetical protein
MQPTTKRYQNIDNLLENFEVEKGRGLEKKVNDLVIQLQQALSDPDIRLKPIQYKKLGEIFFDKLSKLSRSAFDRTKIEEHGGLEKQLAEAFRQRHHQKAGVNELRGEVYELHTRRKLGESILPTELEAELVEEEAKLAIALGVKPKSGAGAMSNSYFLYNVQGKKIAIFKPDVEGARGKKNPKLRARINTWLAKNIFKFLSLRQMRQRFAETFTFKASLLLHSPIVPPSKIATFSSKELGQSGPVELERGSLQILVSGAPGSKIAEAKDVLNVAEAPTVLRAFLIVFIKWVRSLFVDTPLMLQLKKDPLLTNEQIDKAALKNIPESLFYQMAFLDFATGQVDRHYGNFMLKVEDPKKSEDKNSHDAIGVSVDRLGLANEKGSYLVMIDNGAALGKAHPQAIEARNMYLFSELALSKKPIRDVLPEGIPPKGWDTALRNEFLHLVISEDVHDLKSFKSATAQTQILDFFSKKDPLAAIEAHFGDTSDVRKLKVRLKKVIEQLHVMEERFRVLNLFLNPPKGHEKEYTLQLLGSIRTTAEFQAFWKLVDAHRKDRFKAELP